MAEGENPSKAVQEHWDNVRTLISRASIFAQSQIVAQGIAGTNLQSSIAEALQELDTSQVDPVASLGEGDTVIAQEPGGGEIYPRRKGKIQRVEDAIALLYGDGENPGLFDQFKDLPDLEV